MINKIGFAGTTATQAPATNNIDKKEINPTQTEPKSPENKSNNTFLYLTGAAAIAAAGIAISKGSKLKEAKQVIEKTTKELNTAQEDLTKLKEKVSKRTLKKLGIAPEEKTEKGFFKKLFTLDFDFLKKKAKSEKSA